MREKRGLAYSVHAWADKYPDTGYFVVQAGVEHAKLEKTVSTILNEFRKIKARQSLRRRTFKGEVVYKGTMTLALETSDEIAGYAATSLINMGKIRPMEEVLKGVEKVTAADIERVARDILQTNKLNLAIIGPHLHAERLQDLLHA